MELQSSKISKANALALLKRFYLPLYAWADAGNQRIDSEDVEIVPLGKLSAVMAALESKQIDGAILNEPNITKVQTAGYGKLVTQVGDVIPYQTSALFFSPKFLKNEDAAVRFLRAYKSLQLLL